MRQSRWIPVFGVTALVLGWATAGSAQTSPWEGVWAYVEAQAPYGVAENAVFEATQASRDEAMQVDLGRLNNLWYAFTRDAGVLRLGPEKADRTTVVHMLDDAERLADDLSAFYPGEIVRWWCVFVIASMHDTSRDVETALRSYQALVDEAEGPARSFYTERLARRYHDLVEEQHESERLCYGHRSGAGMGHMRCEGESASIKPELADLYVRYGTSVDAAIAAWDATGGDRNDTDYQRLLDWELGAQYLLARAGSDAARWRLVDIADRSCSLDSRHHERANEALRWWLVAMSDDDVRCASALSLAEEFLSRGCVSEYAVHGFLYRRGAAWADWDAELDCDTRAALYRAGDNTPARQTDCAGASMIICGSAGALPEAAFAAGCYELAALLYEDLADGDGAWVGDRLLYNAGLIWEQQIRDHVEAARCYQRLVDEYPESDFVGWAGERLAATDRARFRFDEAIATYLDLAEGGYTSETLPSPRLEAARLLAQSGHAEEALQRSFEILDEAPGTAFVPDVVALAWGVAERDEARWALREALGGWCDAHPEQACPELDERDPPTPIPEGLTTWIASPNTSFEVAIPLSAPASPDRGLIPVSRDVPLRP